MWLKREDYERLVTQAAQSEFLAQSLARTEARVVETQALVKDTEAIVQAVESRLDAEQLRFEQERLHWANMAATELAAERERGIQERADHYKLIKAMTDRHYTAQVKTYAVSSALEPPSAPHPKGFIHDPTEIDLAKLEFYKKCARDAGRDEEDAVMRWEAEMRGEGLPIETEVEQ